MRGLPRPSAWACVRSRVRPSFGWTSGPDAACRRARRSSATGGWLAGDAGQGPGPRVRWAQLEVDAGLDPLDLETRVVLHEASVFGLTNRRWTIDRGSLAPEARVLLGEVARGLGPLPSSGGIAALGDLLVALGVVELAVDRTPTLSPDATRALHARSCGRPAPAARR